MGINSGIFGVQTHTMKVIGITGGTGLVGKHLTSLLTDKGYEVVIFTRSVASKKTRPHITYAHWNPESGACDINALKTLDAVVHLAGEGIADKRWTAKRKKDIVESRVNGTSFLVAQLKAHAINCKTLISASATGYYGPDKQPPTPFTETSPVAPDFLGDTCLQWETAALSANTFLRTVILRFGIVLGKERGAFAEFAKPISFGIVPIIGSGNQIVSWIEVGDLSRLIHFAIEQEKVDGIYNAVAPNPVTNKELVKTIAHVKGGIKIPAPAPAFFLKLLLGEMSIEILKSCMVSADKITNAGFTFNHPDISGAVKAILRK